MGVRPSFSRFGFIYGTALALIAIPMPIMYVWQFGYQAPSVGLRVHTMTPKSFLADPQSERVIITVTRATLRLNARPVSWEDLPAALRAELSRHANPVVYVEADGDLSFADIARVIDIARTAWYGVPVVLLTGTKCEHAQTRQPR